ncbi:2-hydroxyacid dehydrogenase [Thioalkalivibrio sp.]|uniref:2-hydroxyacid dehydrogenase n=1 Tax=Thioalkalivibrio sp. TaxID=2093813 RepID=UPI0035689684
MPTALLTNQYAPALQALIRAEAPAGFDIIALNQTSHADIVARASEADYLLVGGRIPIDAAVLNAATRLRMVQRTGVGLDAMDLDAIESRGIPVYVNPGVNAQSVAEHTLMLMLAVLRRLPVVHRSLRDGDWKKHELGIRNRDLSGRRVGLIGLGHIGQAVARLLQPFGVILSYHKRQRLPNPDEQTLGLNYQPLDELIAESEVVSLHCPLTPDTRNLLSRERIGHMRPGAVLINTARGGLVDEPALIEALQHGHLGGAGLDAFVQEPLPAESPLRTLDNVVLSPHISGITRDSFQEMMRRAFHNIAAFEAGELEVIAPMRLR